MHLVFYDDPGLNLKFWPLCQTRPLASLRVGILRIEEKWQHYAEFDSASHLCSPDLSSLFPLRAKSKLLLVGGSILPDPKLVEFLRNLDPGQIAFTQEQEFIGLRTDDLDSFLSDLNELSIQNLYSHQSWETVLYPAEVSSLKHLWQIFQKNGTELIQDFNILTAGRQSAPISKTNNVLGDRIFLEDGVQMEYCTVNSTTGPVYIGRNCELMEGTTIRGPLAMLDQSSTKMGTRIYGPTTIGPASRIGGEIQNIVIQGYSNKAHDGYLGNSILGEWCNIGADSNASNLKNTYQEVKIWSYMNESFIKTDTIFCGLIMGDHAKCGINTMFNTGTVVGLGANIFGAGFPRQFIPDFAWGGATGFSTFSYDQFIETARTVMSRRNVNLLPEQEKLYKSIFDQTAKFRSWEKKM